MRYFITGTTGFIGRRLVGKLCERDGSRPDVFARTLHAAVPRGAQILTNPTFGRSPVLHAAKRRRGTLTSEPAAGRMALQPVMHGIRS